MRNNTMRNIADIIVYAFLFSIIVWVLAKAFGLINSPALVEMYPYIALAITATVAYSKLTYNQAKLSTDQKHMMKSVEQIPQILERLTRIEAKCEERCRKRK